MWPGIEKSREFEAFYARGRVVKHVPSGRTISDFHGEGIGDNCKNLLYSSGFNEPDWQVVVEIRWELVSPRAKKLGFDWAPSRQKEFRSKYGMLYHAKDIYTPAPENNIEWSGEKVEIFLFGSLIFFDLQRFDNDLPPYPDRIDFFPPSIPSEYHRRLQLEVTEP